MREVVREVGGGELEARVRGLGVEWLEQRVDFLGLCERLANALRTPPMSKLLSCSGEFELGGWPPFSESQSDGSE